LTYEWDFGDASAKVPDQSPAHIYTAAGNYTVSLKVTNASSATNTKTAPVTVAAAPGPVAAFTVQCDGPACSFTDASTSPNGALTYDWNFGEPASATNRSTAQNPTHNYTVTAVTPFTVTLTVTDNQNKTATTTQTITVTPPAQLQCGTSGGCTINITQNATVTFTLTQRDCQLGGNRLAITQPIRQTVFFNGCSEPVGKVYTLNNGAAFAAGTQIQAQFTQGAGKPTDPPRGPPLLKLTGGFPNWTLEIDDGGNFGQPGEPDYNDLVLIIQATAQ
jgi:PKD repeat protein